MATIPSDSETCLTVTKVNYYRLGTNGSVRGPWKTVRTFSDKARLTLNILQGYIEEFDFPRIDLVEDGWAVAKRGDVKVILNSQDRHISIQRKMHAYYAACEDGKKFDLADPDSLQAVREQLASIFQRR